MITNHLLATSLIRLHRIWNSVLQQPQFTGGWKFTWGLGPK